MAGRVNKVILIGNLGADPEIRRTQDGRPIANLSVATSESWRDKATGERKEKTEWHRVVIFNEGLCKIAEQYLKKGSKVYLEGQLQTRKWHRQGRRRQIFDRSRAAGFQLARSPCSTAARRRRGRRRALRQAATTSARGPDAARERKPAMAGAGKRDDMDDEIPF